MTLRHFTFSDMELAFLVIVLIYQPRQSGTCSDRLRLQ
jgi:hypothetical protein